MLMVTKRADWYRNKLKAVFGGVRVYEQDGYCVFCAEKRAPRFAARNVTLSQKCARLWSILKSQTEEREL